MDKISKRLNVSFICCKRFNMSNFKKRHKRHFYLQRYFFKCKLRHSKNSISGTNTAEGFSEFSVWAEQQTTEPKYDLGSGRSGAANENLGKIVACIRR